MSARVLGSSPARSALADKPGIAGGKVSVCVCVRAQRKAPARAIFAAAASTAAAYHERACAMTLPRAEGAGPAGIDHCSDSLVGSPRSTHSSS